MFGYLPMCRCITKYIDKEEQMHKQINRLNKLRNENAYLKLDHKQLNEKLLEEVKELLEDGANIKEELGDVLVVLVELARQNNLDIVEVLEKATDKLEGRVKQYNKRMWREFNKEKGYKGDDCRYKSPADKYNLKNESESIFIITNKLSETPVSNRNFRFRGLTNFGVLDFNCLTFDYFDEGKLMDTIGIVYRDLYFGVKNNYRIYNSGYMSSDELEELYNELLDIFYDPKTWED